MDGGVEGRDSEEERNEMACRVAADGSSRPDSPLEASGLSLSERVEFSRLRLRVMGDRS